VSDDATVRLWNGRTGEEVAVLHGHDGSVLSAEFSREGRRLVTASDDTTARIWDFETRQAVAVLRGHSGSVLTAAFSREGRRVVTGSSDKTVRIWDVGTGAEIALLQGHAGSVMSAAFGPDGRKVATASDDGSARIHDVARTATVAGERAVVLTAALARGIGRCSPGERHDLLMRDAPEDLFAEAMHKLGPRSGSADAVVADLHAPLHPGCYVRAASAPKR